MTVSTLTRAIALLGGLFSIAVVISAGDWSNPALVLLGLIFALWTAAPFALVFQQAGRQWSSSWSSGLLLFAAIALTAVSVAVYWRPFIAKYDLDAQDGIILVILPLYQLAAAGLVVGLARFINRD